MSDWKLMKIARENYSGVWECLVCKTKKELQIHHIDRNRENNNPSNLECYCNHHHNKLHFEAGEFSFCKTCGRIMRNGKTHTCPTKKWYSSVAKKRSEKRIRCKKCGAWLGNSKHTCVNPKRFLGFHHTKKAKQKQSKAGKTLMNDKWKMCKELGFKNLKEWKEGRK